MLIDNVQYVWDDEDKDLDHTNYSIVRLIFEISQHVIWKCIRLTLNTCSVLIIDIFSTI